MTRRRQPSLFAFPVGGECIGSSSAHRSWRKWKILDSSDRRPDASLGEHAVERALRLAQWSEHRDGVAVLASVLGHAVSQINGGDHVRADSDADQGKMG
jgi:hypothetical protein